MYTPNILVKLVFYPCFPRSLTRLETISIAYKEIVLFFAGHKTQDKCFILSTDRELMA